MKYLISLILGFGAMLLSAQVGIGTESPHSSAVLEINGGGNKGLLIPRVNLTNVASNTTPVAAPTDGLLVFNNGTTPNIS